ncbi:hypothetical protein MFRU_015g02090 [Monilinia fructicola]|uniref:Uncharacterized protein n=1 Tax=Monilinia fructicola TaxID=38448 RepID=A0A5M9K2R7_MONFR|nr:hypothetical protein EYC84_005777 [Monilinia fructicola]KAG4029675.1 hypothetical protein MFRU_015g02090 [Monilinia fructicola]
MREYDERNSSGPITPSKNRNIVVIEDSTDEEIPSKAPSEVGEVPNFIQETREEVKRRRRQELQGNYDTEPYVPVMDELLDNQIKHYCVLQQRGLVPLQTNKEFGHERFQRIEEFEEPDSSPRFEHFHPNLPDAQSLTKQKKSNSSSSENNTSTIGKSGSGITKRGHVAKKRTITNKKDMLKSIFKGD